MRRIGLIVPLLVALFAFSPAAFADCTQVGPLGECPSPTPTPAGQGGTQADGADPVAIERDFFNRINRERSNRGLSRLSYHADLTGVARRHSARMAQEGRLYHNTSELRSDDFNRRMGYPQMVGENVGEGPSVNWLHDAFMNSTGHRANILESRYTAMGIGVVIQGETIWVTQDFIQGGSRRNIRREFPAGGGRVRRVNPPAAPAARPAVAAQPAVRPAEAQAIRPRPIAPRISALRLPPIPAPIPDEPEQSPRPLLPLAALATLSAVAFASRRDAAAWI